MKKIDKNLESKPDLVYTKKGNYVYIEFKTLMPNKFSSQKRAQLREFDKRIMVKETSSK